MVIVRYRGIPALLYGNPRYCDKHLPYESRGGKTRTRLGLAHAH
jgi:hypothetical protein